MAKRNRWYDRLIVKVSLITAAITFLVGLTTFTYQFAEDQTKKELGIDINARAIKRIEAKVNENSRKLDKLIAKKNNEKAGVTKITETKQKVARKL